MDSRSSFAIFLPAGNLTVLSLSLFNRCICSDGLLSETDRSDACVLAPTVPDPFGCVADLVKKLNTEQKQVLAFI